MPVIRILVSFVVVAVGVLFAVLLLAAGFLSFLLRRLFGRPAAMPQFRGTASRTPPRPSVRPRDDVFDVDATPVKD
jgi:hypothetical protein